LLIEYTGRHTEVAAALRKLAEKKLAKLSKVLPGITQAHVILTVEKHRHIAEVTVHSPHLDLAAVEESGDFESSIATVVDRLTRQAQRHLGKLRSVKRRGSVRGGGPAVWSGIVRTKTGDDGRARVVQSRRFVAKPMTVDEAVLEVDASDDGLFVFRDATTEKLNVLYRRKDGNLGLIEAEV
jgi:putative sigma-54 modulation protein